jgi:uncharacterized protein (DUF1697 family)
MRYLALLRGINVGSSGRIRMDALKSLLEEAGFANVTTYIQSGNVLFNSPLSEELAQTTIEQTLKENAAITTTAVLRTVEALADLMEHCPFSTQQIARAAEANTEGESFYVCLLPQEPDELARQKLAALEQGEDVLAVYQRTVYLLLSQSIRTSKLAIRLSKIFPTMTVRNWNTMTKLLELARLSSGN